MPRVDRKGAPSCLFGLPYVGRWAAPVRVWCCMCLSAAACTADAPPCECRCVVDRVEVCSDDPEQARVVPAGAALEGEALAQLRHDYEAARALQVAGHHAASLLFVERVVNRDPGYRDIYFLRGFGLQRTGQLAEAVVSYRKHLERFPDDAQVHFNLGHALMELGQHREAIAAFDRSLKLDPALSEAHYHLARCHRALGRETQAARHRAQYENAKGTSTSGDAP